MCFLVKSELSTLQPLVLTALEKKEFEKVVGKGENAGYQHFLLFLHCFQALQENFGSYVLILNV